MYIGDMHFHHRSFNTGNRIPDRHGCMGITRRVEYDPICIKTDPLQFSDQFPFNIALEIADRNMGIFFFQRRQELFKRHGAIDTGLSFTEQVQVGAIDDCDLHNKLK